MFELIELLASGLGVGRFAVTDGVRARLRRIAPALREAARDSGVNASLLAGIAMTESSLNPEAVGPPIEFQGGQRALGLFQVTPTTAAALGLPEGFTAGAWQDPLVNARAGALVLRSKGYGREPIRTVLSRYGGFVTVSPDDYIRKVLTWSAALTPELIRSA